MARNKNLKRVRTCPYRLCVTVLSALLLTHISPAISATTDPLTDDALWLVTEAGVAKVNKANGQVGLQVAETSKPRAAAVDEKRALVWVYAKGMLYAYSFGGQLVSTVAVPASKDDEGEND